MYLLTNYKRDFSTCPFRTSLPEHLLKIFCLEIDDSSGGLRSRLCIPWGWEVVLDPLVMVPLHTATPLMVWEQVGIPILPDPVVLRKFSLQIHSGFQLCSSKA